MCRQLSSDVLDMIVDNEEQICFEKKEVYGGPTYKTKQLNDLAK